jgi:hypothetical protein
MKLKLTYLLFFVAVILCLSGAAMFLWDVILPHITHLPQINYWQALGLTILSRILFGKLPFDGPFEKYTRRKSPNILKDKLMAMDEHDKASFREEWRKRCERRG